jgi:hypothetical protein
MLLAMAGWGGLAWWSHAEPASTLPVPLGVLGGQWMLLAWVLGSRSLRGALSLRTVWLAAVLFRLCGLLAVPVLEDDQHRGNRT